MELEDSQLNEGLVRVLKPLIGTLGVLREQNILATLAGLPGLKWLQDVIVPLTRSQAGPVLDSGESELRNVEPGRGRPILRLTVTAVKTPLDPFEFPSASGGTQTPATNDPTLAKLITDRLTFQYSALSDTAVIPMREVEVQPYFVEALPFVLIQATAFQDQKFYGHVLANYLLPHDFRRLIESGQAMVLAVDSTTAVFPWEMAAIRGQRGMLFFGPHLCLTRQFRTTRSASPGIAPPLNNRLRILVIADPNTLGSGLKGSRREALDIIKTFGLAQKAWGKQIVITVDVRIGEIPELWNGEKAGGEGYESKIDQIHKDTELEINYGDKICDPNELLGLLLNDHYDVVHYTGHSVYDARRGRKGWIFRNDCVLSATEILQTRNVPRLVFANSCVSAAVDSATETKTRRMQAQQTARNLTQYVTLVEAFFERGLAELHWPWLGLEGPGGSVA